MVRKRAIVAVVASAAILAVPPVAQAKVIKVHSGQSIQAAVDQAHPGDTVRIAPGTYTEAGRPCPSTPGTCAVVVDKNDISIVGMSGKHGAGVTLQAAGGQDNGISIGMTGDPACLSDPGLRLHGSLLKRIAVQGFSDNGVYIFCVAHWRVTKVTARDNAEYAIFPSHSFTGRVDHSFASGARDTGFYIGQSFNSRMDHNVATGNVSGYEIENSIGINADHNLAEGNTGGILSFTLPFLDAKVNSDNVIAHNVVRDNNEPNNCIGGDVCEVPSGTGVLLVAADNNVVGHNHVTGNDSFGIAVSNICLAQGIPDDVCATLDIQPDSDNNRIVFNRVLGNGTHPDPILPAIFAVDLAWDTTGIGNCWSKNVYDTSFPPQLPSC